MEDRKYTILWVDDDIKTAEIELVKDNIFELYGDKYEWIDCQTGDEAISVLKNPSRIDAAILDARFDMKEVKSGSTNALRQVAENIRKINDKGNQHIPIAIYTKQFNIEDKEKDRDFFEEFEQKGRVFDKKASNGWKEMFAYIEKQISEVDPIISIVKTKYTDVLDIVSNPEYGFKDNEYEILVKVLVDLEKQETTEATHLNALRDIVINFLLLCKDTGLIPEHIDKNKTNEHSKFLCRNEFTQNEDDRRTYIPFWVQNSIAFLVRITQPGSHPDKQTKLFIKKAVTNGNAPYLITSLVFALCNVLLWWKQFIDSKPNWIEIENYAMEVYASDKPQNPVHTASFKGLIEVDEEGILHLGPYYIGQSRKRAIGKEAEVTETFQNTSEYKNKYRLYANYKIIKATTVHNTDNMSDE